MKGKHQELFMKGILQIDWRFVIVMFLILPVELMLS